MTSVVTLVCPEGIVVAADMRQIEFYDYWLNLDPLVTDGVQKIYRVKRKANVAIACWGLAQVSIDDAQRVGIIDFLNDFDKNHLEVGDSVDAIAEKLRTRLQGLAVQVNRPMGFHVVGFMDEGLSRKPKLRHVFHEKWHDPGEFTNEDSHSEYFNSYGNKICLRVRKDCPVLFNGDSLVANLLFNYAKKIELFYDIVPNKLTLNDCENLASMIIGTSTQRLDYFFDLRKLTRMPRAVGGGMILAKITQNSFDWKKRKDVQ